MKKQILTFLILLLPFLGFSQDFMIWQKPFASSPPLGRFVLLDDGDGNYTKTTLQAIIDQVPIPEAEGDGFVSGLNWNATNKVLTVFQTGASQQNVTLTGLAYTLPIASAGTLGGIKVGTGLSMAGDGTLSASGSGYTLPTASTTTKGGVKVDGSSITITNEVISADEAVVAYRSWVTSNFNNYALPAATAGTRGGIRVGSGLSISGDVLSATGSSYSLPAATTTVRGGIKVGNGLAVTSDVLRANISGTTNTLPLFTSQYGIGNSYLSQTGGFLYSQNPIKLKGATYVIESGSSSAVIQYSIATGAFGTVNFIQSPDGIMTGGMDGLPDGDPWKLGGVSNGADVPATRRIRVEIGGVQYDILAIPVP